MESYVTPAVTEQLFTVQVLEFPDVSNGTDIVEAHNAVSGNATVGGTLGVTGVTTLTGAATVGGTLGVTGATTVGGTLGVTGATTLSAALTYGGVTLTNNVTGTGQDGSGYYANHCNAGFDKSDRYKLY